MLPPLLLALWMLGLPQSVTSFQVSLNDEGLIVARLERSDLQDNVTAFAAQLSGEPRLILVQFVNTSEPLVFNTSFHGLCYTVGLLVKLGQTWSRPVKTIPVLTKPLPVHRVHISDYKESPETGVVFQMEPPAGNVFSRVNISFTEGPERRSMLYKDFYKGKTVFKHWLPGVCYRNITFQLISEVTVYQTALVTHSDITHSPVHHRTVPYPPLNISHKIVHLSQRTLPGETPDVVPPEGGEEIQRASRQARDIPPIEEQQEEENTSEEVVGAVTRVPFSPTQNLTGINAVNESTETQSYWLDPTDPSPADREEEFVNAVVSEYEDSNEPGSAMGLPPEAPVLPTKLPPILLELRWLPPRPPTSYDGFNVYIYREGSTRGTLAGVCRQVTRNVMRASLPLPPGDIYNLTVTACTERSRNTSIPTIIKLEPAAPRSVYAVNATHSSVTLLWTEDGVVDYYQVLCRANRPGKELKTREPQTSSHHVVTVSGLTPSSSYNCSVTSFSYSTASKPAHITISTAAKEMNPTVAAISALAVLSILLISLLILFLLVLRKKHLQMTRECGAETFVNFASFERDGKLPYNWRRSLFAFLTLLPSCLWTDYLLAFYINPWSKTALKKRKLTSPVQLDDFDAYFKEMSKDSAYKFSLQFEELKSVGLDLCHDAADLPINRPKNRYTNILPYDFSRVKLISMHDDEGSDYINANYIPGYKNTKEYIATQGPLPETRNDFWKMVLQEKCPIVVMLTQCNERRRVKCDHYWPFTDEPVMYGEISVEMLSESESPEWTIRKFRLGYADESQDVLHLNYTSWPDHGVPTVNAIESILQFVHIVRQQANRTRDPVIVHCSAGVGRTGTFMALDRLMQHIREHEFADILGMVSEMRSHRLSMVQTEEQYVFIHQCVLLMWQKKKQSITSDVIYENASKT
ncbi:receptor-type tyrosine-protein phosphatase O [Anarrhichthys ocellatus]|uniref:receptor-type tyrosine-protein phosphatase O n=1 Tax=Anarrhichthys ocellatus TaxID=433405 RepID=UPI0012EDB9CF|nr:receptor-type tyrosine-protein phosphatase O [Anarrhichthys ocellatus]